MGAESRLRAVRCPPDSLRERSGGIDELLSLDASHGDVLTADFRQFYGVRFRDYVALPSSEDVHEALVLTGQLLVLPESRYAAIQAGGIEHRGWGTDRYLAANLRDLLLMLLKGLGGEKTTADELWPRPQLPATPAPVGSIEDFDTDGFLAGRW